MAETSRPGESLRTQSTAWMQVLGAFLLLFNSGIVTSYGIFEIYYKETLLSESSTSDISWIGTVQGFVVFATGAIIASPVFNRGHLRALLLVGALLLVAGLMLASFAQNFWQIFLTHGLLVGLGCGCIFFPGVAIVPTHFTTRRTIAMGIAASGASCGSVVYPVVFRQLIGHLGFAWTIRVISFIALAGLYVSLAVLKLKEPPAPKPPSPSPHPPLSPLPPTPAATPAPEMQSVLAAPPPLVSPLLRPSSPLGAGISIVSPTLRSPASKEMGAMSPAGLTPLSEAWLRSQPSQETLAAMSSLRPQPLRSPASQETLTMSPSRFSPLADPWVRSQTSRDRLNALPPLRTYASYETMTSPLVPVASAEPLLPPTSALPPLLSTPSPSLIASLPSPSMLTSKPMLYPVPSYDSTFAPASKELGPSCPSTPASSSPPSPVTHAPPPLPAVPASAPPSKPPLLDFRALIELPFFIYALGCFFLAIGIYVPIFFLSTFVSRNINDDGNFSYYIVTILNAASAVGRIVPALVADRIGPINTILPALAIASLLTFAWIKIESVGGIVVFAIAFGFVSGAAMSLPIAMVPSCLSPSMRLVGSRIGLGLLFVGFGLLISGPIGGALIDLETASFWKMQVFAAAFSSAALLCFVWLRLLKGRDRPGWRL